MGNVFDILDPDYISDNLAKFDKDATSSDHKEMQRSSANGEPQQTAAWRRIEARREQLALQRLLRDELS